MNPNSLTKNKESNWTKIAIRANGYFMVYAILLFAISLWHLSSTMEFYTAETGFHYKADKHLAVKQQINALQSKYTLSNTQIRLEQTSDQNGKLIVNFDKPTAEHENDLFIYDLHNNEYLHFEYDNAYRVGQTGIEPGFLMLYTLLTLLIFVYWRVKFSHFDKQKQPLSTWTRPALKILAWVLFIVFCMQLYAWLLNRIGIDFQSDTTQMGVLFYDHPMRYLLFMVVLAPIQEELVFRGIMLRLFINQNRVIIGSFFTSVLFAALHQIQMLQQPLVDKINNYVVTFLTSLLLCYIYNKYRRIGASIFAHALFNLLMTLLAVGIPI